ncbi:hypothetical protein E8D34_09060 [Nocardioides sp. GY 10113]|uniref:acVLRF1 family peptidyl-tRNA hydrolase n=1 Tax=Nocardioides sp. GY 10113 TaxID=2569761 RepID=UPI0010A83831|nr:acVLRF1 family peptidyl-tRNA hydrolase [Nocardioides sp. GY 10113]TIC87802.1 hypothetical protein E8D34_09060 [Nocardioides sp. GY 10113]
MARHVLVPAARWSRWVDGFCSGRSGVALRVEDGVLRGTASDGSWFRARLPFDRRYDGVPDAVAFAAAAAPPPPAWGVLLVRKGGFAVARLAGAGIEASKVGQRHVQGRTKAGGQSQQRFARRRDNQAREAYEAAAGHAVRILTGEGRVDVLVTGGDHAAVEAVLADPRLAPLTVVGPWLAVPDPRRSVLEQAVADACAIAVEVENAPPLRG